eukprot:scaffold1167_cov154-Isochrysis_galbana.AAC.4
MKRPAAVRREAPRETGAGERDTSSRICRAHSPTGTSSTFATGEPSPRLHRPGPASMPSWWNSM